MRALVLNGSPKGDRSNTYRLTRAFVDGCRKNTEIEVTSIWVNQLNLKPCLGCFACWNKIPGKCCLSDDMARVIEAMLWADIIVWSFPLYYFSVPGPLKNLMDRQLPMVLPFMEADSQSGSHPTRYDLSGKRHVVISTCGFYTAQGNYDGVNAIFDHLCGKGGYETIYCGQGELFRFKELSQRTDAYLKSVESAGAEFMQGSISADTRTQLSQLLFPRATFEAMADASWGVEKTGEKTDEDLIFTRQMAALYNPASWNGKDRVLEMDYIDLGRRYQIILGQSGYKVITQDFLPATTVIHTPYTVWLDIASGAISGEDALMRQKYRVTGDFDLMIHWDDIFGTGSDTPQNPTAAPRKLTNMLMMLIPWMTFWIGTSAMSVPRSAYVSILVSCGISLILFKFRPIFFDYLSWLAVAVCSLLLLEGVPVHLVLPLSYFGFGLLWTVGGMLKIPLTAHYSLNDYGGEGMLKNGLFLRTNRILTLCWGVLYLAMTAWSWPMMRAGFSWIGIVNSILPAAMGLFTAWFQKWYPAYYAKGKS